LSRNSAVEVVLVDDGSRDGTWNQIQRFAQDRPCSLEADLQDPPAVILKMLAEWEAGADVVYAIRRSRHG